MASFNAPDALGVPARLQVFAPSHAAALLRLQAVTPAAYARSRNALDGAVTGLSPYLTHGLLGLAEAARHVHARHPLTFDDKLVFEFAWREFFHHVWSRAARQGDAILQDMHGQLPWHGSYADTVPADIREGRTGVPAIDCAVRVLYATGYLHNHARMWLASYVVHLRKVHWRAGADWLYAHLLDGDLPSNHLSWQWVAATFSGKPYLFNADNVLKYAPADARDEWASAGTVIDNTYEALDQLARQKGDVGPERGVHAGVAEPLPIHLPPNPLLESFMPGVQLIRGPIAIESIANKSVQLIHPWSLSALERDDDSHTLRLGVIHLPAHASWPWSERRWQFVLQAMAGVVKTIWIGDITSLDASQATRVTAQATRFPGYREALASVSSLTPEPRLLPNPAMACRSFSKFYERVRREVKHFPELL